MDRALWLLLRLRLVAWLRRLRRNVASVRGALLVLVGGGFFVLSLSSALFVDRANTETLEQTRRIGPVLLIVLCLAQVVFSGGEGGLTFTPAEVNWLFPGPVSRRQLLAYKITSNLGLAAFSAIFLGLLARAYTAQVAAAIVGILLILFFLQLFSLALTLVANAVGARAYSRQRKIVLAALIALLALIVWQAGRGAEGSWRDVLDRALDTQAARIVLAPVSWFIQALTAEHIWPDLLLWSALSLGVNGVLLALVFVLDAQYLEASAVASERLYAKLERLRRGGASATFAASGQARLTPPGLPIWGGVGPIAWRQLATACRSWKSILFLLGMTALWLVIFGRGGRGTEDDPPPPLTGIAPMMLILLTVFGPSMLVFDFRGDLDRMDLLKSWPIASWRLSLGQILTPALILTLLQLLVVVAIVVIAGTVHWTLWSAAAFALPLNLLMVGLENWLFLLYPSRQTAQAPGDFHLMGRQMVFAMVKMFILLSLLLPATLIGVIVYFVSGANMIATGVAAWLCLLGECAGLVALIGLAFRRFDVSRDVP